MNEQQSQQLSQQNINTPPLIYRIKQYKPQNMLGQFSYMLIRPPRFMYNEQLLYPPEQYQIRYRVEHHQIPFKLTLYKVENMMYVVLYLHGNSSSRFQGYMNIKDLPDGVGLACFDFSGCGMRFQSQYITLGSKESKDVDIAARYLKKLGYKVVGWGRSMGSVSLLLSSEIDIMIADSPFSSLVTLCEQISYKATPALCCCFFHCLYPCLFSCVRSDVEQKAGFDLRELEVWRVLANNPKNKQKALFVLAGTGDGMIHYSHSQKIYDSFPGTKQIQIFEGTHNSNRPEEVLNKCFDFVDKQLGITRQVKKKQINHIKLKPITRTQQKNVQIKINGPRMGQNSLSVMNNNNEQNHMMLEIESNKNLEKRQEIQSLQSIKNVELKEQLVKYCGSPSKQLEIKKQTIDTPGELSHHDSIKQRQMSQMKYDNRDRKNSGLLKREHSKKSINSNRSQKQQPPSKTPQIFPQQK